MIEDLISCSCFYGTEIYERNKFHQNKILLRSISPKLQNYFPTKERTMQNRKKYNHGDDGFTPLSTISWSGMYLLCLFPSFHTVFQIEIFIPTKLGVDILV